MALALKIDVTWSALEANGMVSGITLLAHGLRALETFPSAVSDSRKRFIAENAGSQVREASFASISTLDASAVRGQR